MKKEIVQKPQSKVPSRKRRLLNVVIVISILCIVYDVIAVGNIVYVAKWISCGKQPVIVFTSFNTFTNRSEGKIVKAELFTDKQPVLSGYSGSHVYCSESEARAEGAFISQ